MAASTRQPSFSVALLPPSPGSEAFGAQDGNYPPIPLRLPSPLSSSWGGGNDEDADETAALLSGIEPFSPPPGSASMEPYAWSTSKTALTTYILACEEGCTAHSAKVHEAVGMLRAYRSAAEQLAQVNWSPAATTWAAPQIPSPGGGGGVWHIPGSPSQQLAPHLPMAPTIQNHELLVTCTSTPRLSGCFDIRHR